MRGDEHRRQFGYNGRCDRNVLICDGGMVICIIMG
jgi:hypothetical protein